MLLPTWFKETISPSFIWKKKPELWELSMKAYIHFSLVLKDLLCKLGCYIWFYIHVLMNMSLVLGGFLSLKKKNLEKSHSWLPERYNSDNNLIFISILNNPCLWKNTPKLFLKNTISTPQTLELKWTSHSLCNPFSSLQIPQALKTFFPQTFC